MYICIYMYIYIGGGPQSAGVDRGCLGEPGA